MGIEVGGIEVDIRGRIETLEKDLAAAEAKVRSFDKKAEDSGKAAARARLAEVKKALADEQRALKQALADRVKDERRAAAEAKKAIKEKADAEARAARDKRKAEQDQVRADRNAETAAKKRAAELRKEAAERERNLDAANRLLSEYNPILGAQLRLNRTLQEANELRRRGLISAEQELDVIHKANAQYQQFQRSQQKGGGLGRHQLINLSFQANDVITGLASGQSPGQVAAQQGGQIFQILQQSEGGVMGGLKDLAKLGAGLVNPYTAAAAAVAALGASFVALSARQSDTLSMIRTFDAQIGVLYEGTQATGEGVEQVARDLDVFGGKLSDIKSNLTSFLREGIDPGRLEEFGRASEYLAKVWGMDLAQAGSELAKAFSGGYQEIENLNKAYPFLTGKQLENIESMFKQKNAAEARNEAFRIFNDVYAPKYEAALTSGDRLTKSFAGSWDNLVSAMSNTMGIEKATHNIGLLIDKLAEWMVQFANVKALTQGQLKTEAGRISGELAKVGETLNKAKEDLAAFDKKHPNASARSRSVKVQAVAAAQGNFDTVYSRFKDVQTELSNPIPRDASGKPLRDTITKPAADLQAIYDAKKGKTKKDKMSPDERDVERAIAQAEELAIKLQFQTRAQGELNDAVTAGTKTLEEANREAEIASKVAEYQEEMDKATWEQKARLKKAIDDVTAAMRMQQQIQGVQDIIAQTDAQKKQNAELDLQLKLIGATNRERLVAIAREKALAELREKNISPFSLAGMQRIGAAEQGANKEADVQDAQRRYGRSTESEGIGQANDALDNLKRTEEEMQAVRDAARAEIERQRDEDLAAAAANADEQVKITERAERAKAQIELQYQEARLSGTMEYLDSLASLTSSSNDRLAALGKAAALAEATIAGTLAIQKAWASLPYPANLPAVAATTVATIANIQKIANMKDGGWVKGPGGPRDDKVPVNLSNEEFVVNAAAAKRHAPVLEAMNAGMSIAPAMPAPRGMPSTPMGERGVVEVDIRVNDDGNLIGLVRRESGMVAAQVTNKKLAQYPQTTQFRDGVNKVARKPKG